MSFSIKLKNMITFIYVFIKYDLNTNAVKLQIQDMNIFSLW